MPNSRAPKRTTSFLCRDSDWRMMERLASEHKTTGRGLYSSKQKMLDEALDLFRPRLIEEYRRVFGVNPPEDD